MKRIICIFLAALMLAGCSFSFGDRTEFYYCRREFDYYGDSPVIASEKRDVTGHADDLRYLLSLYLMGPVDTELVCPFPAGTRLTDVQQDDGTLTVILTDTSKSLSDPGFSLAAVCLGKTCMALTGAEAVTIVSGNRTTTVTEADLLLTDTERPSETNESEDNPQ